MLLFPSPRQAVCHEGFYQVKGCYKELDLVAFCKALKAGNEDVKVIPAPLMEKEEYKLTIAAEGIAIASSCDEGFFRAATSLHQMIRRQKGNLALCEIED